MATKKPPDSVNIIDMVNAVVKATSVDVGLLGQLISGEFIAPLFTDAKNWAKGIQHLNLGKDLPSLTMVKGLLGRPFVDSYFGFGLNVDPNPANKEYAQSIDLIRQLISFSLIFPYVVQGVGRIGKLALGGRWSDKADDLIGKVPEEMGIAWALGGILQSIFDQVAGQKIEEYINVTKHPARPDQGLILRLLRQHKVSHAEYVQLMDLIGYNDNFKKLFEGVDLTQMPVTDVQALYLDGQLNDTQCKAYLAHLGFNAYPQDVTLYTHENDNVGTKVHLDSDVNYLFYLYFLKAETAAGTTYRSYAKSAYLEDRITSKEFVKILTDIHLPKLVIDQELAALNFEKAHGRAQFSVSAIKKQYLAGTHPKDVIVHELEKDGYSYDDAVALINTWDIHAASRKPGLTAAKILAYLSSGILSHSQAVSRLQGLGYTLTDAAFLADHPETKSASGGIPFTQGNIQTGYFDGILNISETQALLHSIHPQASYVNDLLKIWEFQKQHQTAYASGTKPLSQQEIYGAWNNGSMSDAQAINLLEQDGYAVTDAEMIWATWYTQKHGGQRPAIAPPAES